jgi:hypothetical protein
VCRLWDGPGRFGHLARNLLGDETLHAIGVGPGDVAEQVVEGRIDERSSSSGRPLVFSLLGRCHGLAFSQK